VGRRQLGPRPGLGGSDGLGHATRCDMVLTGILTFLRPDWEMCGTVWQNGRLVSGMREAPSNPERTPIHETAVLHPHVGSVGSPHVFIRSEEDRGR
jgi:hypothetical protein